MFSTYQPEKKHLWLFLVEFDHGLWNKAVDIAIPLYTYTADCECHNSLCTRNEWSQLCFIIIIYSNSYEIKYYICH